MFSVYIHDGIVQVLCYDVNDLTRICYVSDLVRKYGHQSLHY